MNTKEYVSKPWHFLLSVFLFTAGIKAMLYEETLLKLTGIGFLFVSFGSYITILVSGVLPHSGIKKEV